MFSTLLYACVSVYVIYVCICHLFFRVNRYVPVHSHRLPILGHALYFKLSALYEFSKTLGRFSNQNGGVSVFFIGEYPFYVVSDPEDISRVLHKCLDKLFVYKLIEPLLGKMLVAADVPTWKRSRRIVDLAFKSNLLDDYLDTFKAQADRLVLALGEDVEKGPVDVTDKVTRSFLETACRTTLGTKIDGKDMVNEKYVKAFDTVLEIITIKMIRPWYLWQPIFNLSSFKKKSDEAMQIIFELTQKMIQLRKEEHLQRLKDKKTFDIQGNRLRSLLDILIENSVTEKGSTFTDLEIKNLVDNVLLAAFDTTITEIILTLVCLGSHPEVQDKIYQEIIDVLGEDGEVSQENLCKLVYLEAAIKESIRLYPVAPVVARHASSAVELRNFTLPAGSSILVHLWGSNMNPKYWGLDVEEFKPERWLSDSLPKHPATFASFSPGRRGCPGKMYTLNYFKATLVPILRRFKLTADRSKIKLSFNVMVKAISGHHINIQNR